MGARAQSERGLTLVEIMVVLIIIGIVMSFIGSKIFGAGDQAKARLTRIQLQNIAQKIEQYRLEYNALPRTLNDLVNCNQEVTGAGCVPLMKSDELKDSWGNEFEYRLENGGRAFVVVSYGADGRPGGSGVDFDINLQGP